MNKPGNAVEERSAVKDSSDTEHHSQVWTALSRAWDGPSWEQRWARGDPPDSLAQPGKQTARKGVNREVSEEAKGLS